MYKQKETDWFLVAILLVILAFLAFSIGTMRREFIDDVRHFSTRTPLWLASPVFYLGMASMVLGVLVTIYQISFEVLRSRRL